MYKRQAETLDRAAKEVGVNFIGGFSALIHKGCTPGDEILINSIPEALAVTDMVCSSVNVGTSRNGINMNAVKRMGEIILDAAERTKDRSCIGCAKPVSYTHLSVRHWNQAIRAFCATYRNGCHCIPVRNIPQRCV